MSEIQSTNKRIAKNTLMLYVRMIISTLVTLYTSRVVLNTLGVDDYGIYNVVGGIVAIFSFLNSSMSGATSRFLTYEMGCNNGKLSKIFSSALYIHIGIAILILVAAETVGLWFMNNKLVIPDDRMFAAHVVYQCSVISMMVTVTQVPYNASIIAHEKMDVYAYIELLNVFLKLGIVFILMIGRFDKLILYAILVLVVSILIAAIYRIYCTKKFSECHLSGSPDMQIIKPMLSFSGWDLFGNMSVSVRQQGTSIILNMFYGPALNAAIGLANSVQNVILSFANNVIMAFRPQIIKQYAEQNIGRMQSLIIYALKISLSLFILIGVPLYFESEFVLKIWLKNVPDYTVFFLRVILLCGLFGLVKLIFNIGIHATGRIKLLSFLTGNIYILTVPILYIALKFGAEINPFYYIIVVLDFIIAAATIIIHKRLITDIHILKIIKGAFLPILGLLVLDTTMVYIVHSHMGIGWLRLLISVLESLIVSTLYIYFIIMNKSQRHKTLDFLKTKIPFIKY